ncbi:DNA-3-methyladenine glycosylase family protein [Gluconobacter wancherniae]|uniref:DNA-3-methyladenine glycosylase II n=1 Tax=Gluconobacter wancherniae NBRC 103581 TaxID=656744 RepID=A0A511B457_9PROT|nr:DNA-3-methyladenine glycosylase [Gluconobacter wancherniae]MBF0854652.1 DNA-3-methyladenine glycosylase 2 family protein [Gluconobacter wancherniae]MBS1063735.1 DNA-3-methyladenine glycosylase 2 family protein [Gluconobacter wancherniae]MBS1089571.1 DNA-3-methyladenine glycosylase 2 family protein [Gluconobacter wancherniae]GBD57618.1 DNA-3-methyladenine glycosylase 1 [Gluconobacter wancherniae NBRC 103581]GBR62190.1 DNA-3-methyladenine glycosylase [Gluconobacter wancherniae NBRC 103581]
MSADLVACLAKDSDIAAAMERIGPCRLRGNDGQEPYDALLRAITGQQLHGVAARKIFGRVCALGETGEIDGPPPTPGHLLSLSEDVLRGCGLSAAKLTAMRGVAQARLDGIVPSRLEAADLSDEELIARLITLRGIGRWTVEMLLMFTLDRPDVMPIDDFGVRAGWKRIKGLDVAPTPKVLRLATESFSPWRSALAWYCWRASEEGKKGAPNPLTG